jgi:SAM-dependent methyltransferase
MYEKIKRLFPLKFRRQLSYLEREFLYCTGYLARPEKEHSAGTHIPILIGLNRLLSIERVLELGCGRYSTTLFANHLAFPNLERLDSLENDPFWFDQIAVLAAEDKRINLTLVQKPIHIAVLDLDLAQYDLILVDDNIIDTSRAETLRTITRRHAERNIIVVHDFEHKMYRQKTVGIQHRFRFTALNPNTGVAWKSSRLKTLQLKQMNSFIQHHLRQIPHYDIDGWIRVFCSEYK